VFRPATPSSEYVLLSQAWQGSQSFQYRYPPPAQWPHPDSPVELGSGDIIADRLFEPSPEARARADEIIAAHDEWRKKRDRKKPRGLVAAERKRNKVADRLIELEEQIAETPATSIGG